MGGAKDGAAEIRGECKQCCALAGAAVIVIWEEMEILLIMRQSENERAGETRPADGARRHLRVALA